MTRKTLEDIREALREQLGSEVDAEQAIMVQAAEMLELISQQLFDLTLAVSALARNNPPHNVTAAEAESLLRVCESGRAFRHQGGAVERTPESEEQARRLQRRSNPVSIHACRTALAMYGGHFELACDWILFRDPWINEDGEASESEPPGENDQ